MTYKGEFVKGMKQGCGDMEFKEHENVDILKTRYIG
jgi:hypothetical protein